MSIIGTFKREDGIFTGLIRTLTFTALVTIDLVSAKRGEKSPDYRVHVQSSGPGEIGAAWTRASAGQEYLSVRIDDPSFPAPLDARLVKAEDAYNLVWDRKR